MKLHQIDQRDLLVQLHLEFLANLWHRLIQWVRLIQLTLEYPVIQLGQLCLGFLEVQLPQLHPVYLARL